MFGLDNTPHPISWALAFGDIMHKACGAWAKGKDWQEAFEKRYEQYARRNVPSQRLWNGEFQGQQDGVVLRAMGLSLMKEYISTIKGKPLADSIELQLSRDLGDGIILTGKVDCIWTGGTIVDWKAVSSPKYLSKIQALIYAILSGGPSPFEFHAFIKGRQPYCDQVLIEETMKQENLDRVIEHFIKPIARQIQAGIFPAMPGEYLCSEEYCGYWDACEGRLM